MDYENQGEGGLSKQMSEQNKVIFYFSPMQFKWFNELATLVSEIEHNTYPDFISAQL